MTRDSDVTAVSLDATAVCFDATGTLIETTESVGAVYHRVALEHGVDLPAWRLDDAFLRVLRGAADRGAEGNSFEERCESEMEWWFERIRQTFQATDSTVHFADFPAFAHDLFDAYRAPGAWKIRAGLAETLTALRSEGRRMAVVSNFDHRLPEVLEHLGIKDFFNHIAIPSVHAATKPSRRLFEAVAQALDRPLNRLVYVGDDSNETLEAISHLGIAVLDVREVSAAQIVEFVQKAS